MKYFKIIFLIPQIVATVMALVNTVKKIDDDPEINAAFDRFKEEPKIAETLRTIKVQVAVLKSMVKELT